MLLVRASGSTSSPGSWWLPGGGLHIGESLEACLSREVREETGLDVRIGPLLTAFADVTEPPDGPLHTVRLIYEVTPEGRLLVAEKDGSTNAVAWHPLETAMDLPSPPFVRCVLRELTGRGLRIGAE